MAPLWPKNFFVDILKKLENLVWPPPLCETVSTSGQRKFGPPFLKSLIRHCEGKVNGLISQQHKKVKKAMSRPR